MTRSGEGVFDALDSMANSFWCMFDQPEREINPVASEDAYNFPECDYDRNPTNLYKQIEAKNWTSVNHFLLTGYWSGAFFADSTSPSEQACTWVTKYDPAVKRKKVMWTHLPIHAALSFGAPEGVVQLMVKLAPPTLRCADDQRMLPLHLAFRRGASDTTIALIMDVFPEGVAVRDFLGRTPAECSSEGPNPKRGSIIQTVLYYNQRAWEKKAAKAQDKQVQSVQKALKQKTEKMENMRAAFELIRHREDESRAAFSKVMVELTKFKSWYDEKTPNDFFDNGGVLSAGFVRELTERLDSFHETAEGLVIQQKKAKQELEKNLKDLKAVWEANGWSNDMKTRSFNKAQGKAEESDQSDESSGTSLITSSTGKKEETITDHGSKASSKGSVKAAPIAPKKSEEKKPSTPAEIPSLFNADSGLESKTKSNASKASSKAKSKEESKAKAQKKEAKEQKESPEEKAKEAQEKSNGKVVPDVVSAGSEPEEIKQTISEMTSIDMSDEGGSKTSSKKKALKLKLSMSMLSKQSSKKSLKGSVDGSKRGSKDGSKKGSKDSVDGSRKSGLPPKDPSKQSKVGKVKVKTGSVKVSPSM